MSASDELFEYLDFLENESKQSRILGSVAKASGLFCLASGAVTLATLPGWGLLALAGGVAYGGMCLREARKTGRMMPIPFAEVGIESIVRGISKAPSSGDADDLLDYHYLTDRQKSDYALLSICATELGNALDQVPDAKQQRALWSQVSRRFHQAYRSHIKENPDFISAYADKSELLRFVLASADEMREIQKEAAAIASQYQTQPELPQEVPQSSSIGTNTRLNAVPVAATTVEIPGATTTAVTIADDLGSHIQNTLIVGKPGAGKGILLSNALRTAKAQQPGLSIYVIDPKGDALEQSYWDGCDCVASKACAELMPIEVWEWVRSCIREFQMMKGPKLLVLDELRYLSNSFARCNDRQTKALDTFWYIVESFTSLGDAQRSHVWGVSQSTHTADLKVSGGTMGQFRVVALVNCADFGFYDTLVATSIVQRHPDPDHLREVVAMRSPVHRIYYDSKFRKWFPLPELPNHSGRDRDKGIEDKSAGAAPTDSPTQAELDRTTLEALVGSALGDTPEAKVVAYLAERGQFLPSYQIKSAIRELRNVPAKDVLEMLGRMADEGLIAKQDNGTSTLFGPTGT